MASTINAKTTGTGGIEYTGDASGNVAIQSDGTTVLNATASGVEVTGTLQNNNVQVATQNALGVRNLIINGDMRIAQRGTSATKTGSGFGYFLIDRFGVQAEDDGSGYNLSQSTDAPAGFQYSMLLTVTTTDTLDATSDNHCLGQRIEGNNIAYLKWGTSDAETVTLSFWVKSSLTGTFGGALSNAVNSTRAYGFTYTINSANTWEYKTITIPGETTGTWATDNGIGIWVTWSLGANAGRQTTANQWDTIASRQATGVYGEDDIIGTSGATFYITGVQLEVGDTATPFEHRPYDVELQRCLRYFEKSGGTTTPILTANESGFMIANMYNNIVNNSYYADVYFKVIKRTNPTVVTYPYSTPTNTGRWSNDVGTDYGASSATTPAGPKQWGFNVANQSGTTLTIGSQKIIIGNWYADAEL